MADDRTYIRVHDGMDEHPKIEGLSDAAFRLLFRTWFYCSRQLTDGTLALAAWNKRGTRKARREIEAADLVHLPGDTCPHKDCADPEPGFVQMHDYLDWQRSAAEVAELKAAKGAGGQLGNHIKWHVKRRQPNPDCEFCIANGSDYRSDNRSEDRSQTDRSPIANGSHSHKQRQIQDNNSSRGVSHVSNARASTPPRFPDHCDEHADTAEPGKCGLCGDRREANKARRPLALVHRDTLPCLVHMEDDVKHCRGCAADRKAVG